MCGGLLLIKIKKTKSFLYSNFAVIFLFGTGCRHRFFYSNSMESSAQQKEDKSSSLQKIGRFQSRSILRCSNRQSSSLVIMIPGSGANGPEEMAPSSVTLSGKDSSIFEPIALAFNQSGFHTLQLGKPGVDFFSGWNGPAQRFYDERLYKSLKWKDLLSNVSDAIAYSREQRICPSSSIYLMGHSEGTMVAVDAASSDTTVAGLILLGFTGGPYKSIIEWQMYERIVEWFLKRDVDVDHDGFISREEANRWPGAVRYPWRDGQNQVSVDEVRRLIWSQPDLHSAVETFGSSGI